MDGLVAIARCRGSFLFRFRGHSGCSAQALSFEAKNLPIKHIPGPEGVRGRNSNNELIKEKLGYAHSVKLADGLKVTFEWISGKIAEEVAGGANAEEAFSKSTICGTMAPTELGALRAADGAEGLKTK